MFVLNYGQQLEDNILLLLFLLLDSLLYSIIIFPILLRSNIVILVTSTPTLSHH